MARRFFDPQPFTAGVESQLGDMASHHIARVLRMRVGDPLTVFNGEGGEWQAHISQMDKRRVCVIPEAFDGDDRTPALAVTLGLPMIKGERMDYALQKATELGVTGIQLLEMARSDVRLAGERLSRKTQHWQQVIISACEQCGMNRLPTLQPPQGFTQWTGLAHEGLRLLAHPGLPALDRESVSGAGHACLITGPEGGFTDEELDVARAAGFTGFSLGERVLRAETAPVALLAALHSLR